MKIVSIEGNTQTGEILRSKNVNLLHPKFCQSKKVKNIIKSILVGRQRV